MSRLIVRGLPSYLTDVRLREHFSQKGAVTDVKLMRRPDGTSRKFGFVGYRSEQEAQQALDYFNRTFIDTSRITVEFAKKIGDEELTRQREERRNRRNAEVVAQEEAREGKKRKFDAPDSKEDGKEDGGKKKKKGGAISFEEFMSVMQPKAKRKAWQNEDGLPQQTMQDITAPEDKLEKKAEKKVAKKKAADAAAQAHVQAQGDGSASAGKTEEEEEAEPDAVANDVGLTDEEYMRLRMKHKVGTDLDTLESTSAAADFEQSDDEQDPERPELSDSDSSDEETKDEESERKQAAQRRKAEELAAKEQKIVDQIMESGRLFVRNLPFAASEDEIQRFFESFGTVKQVHIPLDKSTKASKGLAFVSFTDASHALAAFRAKDGSTFQGRLLHLLPAVNKDTCSSNKEEKQTLKQSRAESKKQQAGQDFNWSMLYMSSDAVASSIADRLGVSKSDILNPVGEAGGGDNAAVRLALAETRIIQETKEFFGNQGINVDAFNTSNISGGKERVERSNTTMLVKNIPYGTSVEEVEKLFTEFGEVDKILIPPSGTIAIVQMLVEGEAKIAFRAVAYKRFKGSILYLEKAPIGLISEGEEGRKKVQAPIVGKTVPSKPDAHIGGEEEVVDGATLYVKNLSFSTTDQGLASLFHGLDEYVFARVQTKPSPKGGRLSMGYGFVGFKSIASARAAQKVTNGKVLDGHTLVVDFARRNTSTPTSSPSSNTGTKILVKNLPFEATKRDISQLFSSQGQLKSVRLPKKFDNSTRGFAFVEYTTAREAQSAMDTLKHTHLLGRHLVLQWTKTGTEQEQVDLQRNKTKATYVKHAQAEATSAKIKLSSTQIAQAVKNTTSKTDQD